MSSEQQGDCDPGGRFSKSCQETKAVGKEGPLSWSPGFLSHLDGIWSLYPSLFSQSPEMDPMTTNVASGLYLGTPLGDVNRFLENLGTSTPVRK